MSDAATQLDGVDPLRAQLLEAAARVFAARGYSGSKIQDIVREAGLSTGAVYGRFRSKDDLMRAAVLAHRSQFAGGELPSGMRVADLIKRGATEAHPGLTDTEAVRLEAFITARREPEIAEAVAEAQEEWRSQLQPLVDAALADGTVAHGVDPEAVVYFVRTVHLGLLLQRAAGLAPPSMPGWSDLVDRIVGSFGDES